MALSKKQKENTKRKYRFPFIPDLWRSLDRSTVLLVKRVIGGLLLLSAVYIFV